MIRTFTPTTRKKEIKRRRKKGKENVNLGIRIEGIYVNCSFSMNHVWYIYDLTLIFTS